MLPSIRPASLFLMLAVLGTVLPLVQLVPWLFQHGFNVSLFIALLFDNRISAFFAWDVIISAIALLAWVALEGRAQRIPYLWLPVVATLTIGVSAGLPLFLYLRTKHNI